jgi:hypothetical protein
MLLPLFRCAAGTRTTRAGWDVNPPEPRNGIPRFRQRSPWGLDRASAAGVEPAWLYEPGDSFPGGAG